MNTFLQKSNDEVTVCWKGFCIQAAGILGVILVIGFAAYAIADAAKSIDKLVK